jgi:hypothetical protein
MAIFNSYVELPDGNPQNPVVDFNVPRSQDLQILGSDPFLKNTAICRKDY